MKVFAKNAMFALRRLRAIFRTPRFHFLEGRKWAPEIEPQCEFRYPRRISVGKNVRFLRGAVVHADRQGSILLNDGVAICRYSIVQSVGGNISIGARTLVGDYCNLYGQGGLDIGADVMIASGCRIVPNEHTFMDQSLPVSVQPCISHGIVIGEKSWLGTNVVVLDGVTIGVGCVVGAGAVVTRSLPDYSVAVGVPAKVIRTWGQSPSNRPEFPASR